MGGGAISIAGVASTGTNDAIALNKTNIFATSGNISLDGGSQRVILGQNGANYIGGSTSAADHTGNLNICAGNVVFNSAYWAYLRTAGNLVIEPCSGSFTAAQSWLGTDVSMVAKSARFGRTGNSGNITVSTAMTLAGDLEVIGGAVTYNGTGVTTTSGGNVTVTATGAYAGAAPFTAAGKISITATTFDGTGALSSAGADGITVTTTAGDLDTGANMTANTSALAPITLKSTGNILLGNNLTSAGGPILLWADSDNANYGGILTAAASTITSNGGAVTLSGGVDVTTGYAKATNLITSTNNTAYSGIRMLGKIVSGAGKVVIRGQDNPTIGSTSHNSGIEIEKTAAITTTSGGVCERFTG